MGESASELEERDGGEGALVVGVGLLDTVAALWLPFGIKGDD